jgi:hypothetical protein
MDVPSVDQPDPEPKNWRSVISDHLRRHGISEEYLYKDFPNNESHREKNLMVKLSIMRHVNMPGMGRYFPSPHSTPRQFCELIDRVIYSRLAGSMNDTVCEFANISRNLHESYEAMMLRIVYLRSMLEKGGIKLSDRTATRIILDTLVKDAAHTSWIKAILDKDKGPDESSVIWDDLMMKLWELSLSEQAGVAGVGA